MQESVKEIIFLVEEDPEGGYTAQALGHSIFTQADSIEELKEMVKDAVECHFDEKERPQ
ncbi:MAG TPA: 2-oxoisovalerate dehydrogenase, partial [Deltaproteobacteria bacterium]|nr:2-oxoisovalerate dehydrogenase [Deltaproteobacteria bacterium]